MARTDATTGHLDWLGAGAIIEALAGILTAEADLAVEAFRAVKSHLPYIIRENRSGHELSGWGYGDDVEVALEVGITDVVPLMRNGAYQAA